MKYDVIVVGGGIIGVCSAYFLAKSGQKVLLLERGEIGQGTTANSFAWANATSKTTDQTYHDLNAMGLAGYHALLAEFGADALGIRTGGALQIADPDDVSALQSLRAQATALAEYGHPSRWIDTAELRRLEPNLKLPNTAQALFSPDDLCINAPHFTRFIADQTRSLGGQIFEHCAAETLLADDDGVVTGLTCDRGDLRADNVLVTTGPDTAQTLSTLTGYDGFNSGFPMQKVSGLLLTTPPVAPDLLGRLIYGFAANEVHILPEGVCDTGRAGGTGGVCDTGGVCGTGSAGSTGRAGDTSRAGGGIKIGADAVDGLIAEDQSPQNLRRAGQILLERAAKLLPALATINIDDCQLGIGVRAYPNDGISIAGPMPAAHGLYLIATHSGITLAPAIGRMMAETIQTGQMPDPLEPFGLQRFSGFS